MGFYELNVNEQNNDLSMNLGKGSYSICCLFIILVIIIFGIYSYWILTEDVKDETLIAIYVVLIGMIYVISMIATVMGFHYFNSLLLLCALVLGTVIAGMTQLKDTDGKVSDMAYIAFFTQIGITMCLCSMIFCLWNTGFLFGPLASGIDKSLG